MDKAILHFNDIPGTIGYTVKINVDADVVAPDILKALRGVTLVHTVRQADNEAVLINTDWSPNLKVWVTRAIKVMGRVCDLEYVVVNGDVVYSGTDVEVE